MKALFRKDGFTLIELMIVVAIIGILAAIAIPNFLKFQAKAKQSEVRANLGGFFSALEAFRGEFNSYTTDLFAMGWGPSGSPRYLYGFQTDNHDPSGNLSGMGAGVGAGRNTSDTLPDVVTTEMIKFDGNPLLIGDLPASSSGVTFYTFGAVGNLDNDATLDVWTINSQRVMFNTQPNDVGS